METRVHGGPADRGAADAYYGRSPDPHKYPNGTSHGECVKLTDPDEIKAYMDAYQTSPFRWQERHSGTEGTKLKMDKIEASAIRETLLDEVMGMFEGTDIVVSDVYSASLMDDTAFVIELANGQTFKVTVVEEKS